MILISHVTTRYSKFLYFKRDFSSSEVPPLASPAGVRPHSASAPTHSLSLGFEEMTCSGFFGVSLMSPSVMNQDLGTRSLVDCNGQNVAMTPHFQLRTVP